MPASKEQREATAKRRAQLLVLKSAGASYTEIASTLGYANAAAAATDLRRVLQDEREALNQEAPNALVLELTRLGGIQRAVETVMNRARKQNDGGEVLRAADRLLRVSHARAGLLGLENDLGKPAAAHPADELRARRERRRRAVGS